MDFNWEYRFIGVNISQSCEKKKKDATRLRWFRGTFALRGFRKNKRNFARTMNWTVIIIETLAMTATFTAMVLIPLVKNPVWWIHDYPKDIQAAYFKSHERVPAEFFSPTVFLKKGLALLLVLAVLLGLLWLAGVEGFWQAFAVGYGMWLFIDWYDCFFLDWLIFANMKAVRLPGTEHMDKAYHQKRYHFVQSLWGMLIGLIPCLAGAGLYAWLF